MIEITNHEVYALLENKYDRVGLDYVLLLTNEECGGLEVHRRAVLEAFHILNKRFAAFDYCLDLEPGKMVATVSSLEELLQLPTEDYDKHKVRGTKSSGRSFSIPTPLPYWFAFLEPPQGTPYLTEDFIAFNQVLFPHREGVEVYRWNDAFSNYFDAGKEGWGTGLWTVFDKKSRMMVVIGASLTD